MAARASSLRVRRINGLLALTLALFAPPASAFLDAPYITPANPVAGQLVSVNIYGGECDLVDMGISWPPPVTQQGSSIEILFTGIHEVNPEWCYYGLGTATYPVGTFSPGSYTLDVERRYGTIFGEWEQETLGTISFTVSATPSRLPVDTPTLNRGALAVLLIALVGVALRNLRERVA